MLDTRPYTFQQLCCATLVVVSLTVEPAMKAIPFCHHTLMKTLFQDHHKIHDFLFLFFAVVVENVVLKEYPSLMMGLLRFTVGGGGMSKLGTKYTRTSAVVFQTEWGESETYV